MKGSRWGMLSLSEVTSSLEEGLRPQPSCMDLTCIIDKCTEVKDQAHALRDDTFDRLVCRHDSSWNSLLIGYVKCGKLQQALDVYRKVENDDSVQLSGHTFVALLKACAKLHDLPMGLQLHTHIARSGLLEGDLFVGSTLVDMYVKCGLLTQAQRAFNKLQQRSVVSWTALIAGYAEHGPGLKAIQCFEQMQREGISPNAVTFVCTLKACSAVGAMVKGIEIHAEVERQGLLETDLHVGATLVSMYSKFGLLARAQHVFCRLPVRNMVIWNALIIGYAEYGDGEDALNYYDQMQSEGVSLNSVSYVCILKVCGSIRASDKGQEIHAEVERQGLLAKDLVLGNSLVDMYVKCDLLGLAQQVFDKLPTRDVISWTTIIAGYAELEHNEEALKFLEKMQLEGLYPDATTYICCLKACGSMKNMGKGQELHMEIERSLLDTDLSVRNSLIEMYSKCGCFALAWQLFNKLPFRDNSSWSALVVGYAEHGLDEEVLRCFEQMQLQGISPNAVTYVCTLKACGSVIDAEKGQEIHTAIERQGLLEKNLFLGSILVDMYVKCGLLAKAQLVFDKLKFRNAISWTSLIAGYAENSQGEDALHWFAQMQKDGFYPDAATYVCTLKACASIGAIDKGEEMHAEIERRSFLENGRVGSALIDMYVKCGCLSRAQELFDKLPSRDVVSWTALMVGYTQLGWSEEVIFHFDKMLGEGIKPNLITFVVVLNACSRRGFFNESQTYFTAMSEEYGIAPTLEHHSCMVDLFGRNGELDEAVSMFKRMPFDPNFVTWYSVLGACEKWGNWKVGKDAYEHVVHLDEKMSAAC